MMQAFVASPTVVDVTTLSPRWQGACQEESVYRRGMLSIPPHLPRDPPMIFYDHSPRPLILRRQEDFNNELHALCDQGLIDNAFNLLSFMDEIGLSPSEEMFVRLLKACGKRKACPELKQFFNQLMNAKLEVRGLLGDSLVITLARCGNLDDAQCIFHTLRKRTIFSWTALISGFVESGRHEEALQMHQHMLEDKIVPNHYTYASLFKACGYLHDLEQASRLLASAHGFTSHVFVGSALISMYGRCGCKVEAEQVFIELSQRNIVSWNAMLSAYVELGHGDRTLRLYRQMEEEDVQPDCSTYVIGLQACGALAEMKVEGGSNVVEIGQALHADIWKEGLTSDPSIASTLVSMYGKCGCISQAENAFQVLSECSTVAWSSTLSAYVEVGHAGKALQAFSQMQVEGFRPKPRAFASALQACGALADKVGSLDGSELDKSMLLEVGYVLHGDAEINGFVLDFFLGSTLISMYSKCGSLAEAENVFSHISSRDVVLWNTILTACVEQNQQSKVLLLYKWMQKDQVNPNKRTFAIIFGACTFLAEREENILIILEVGRALHSIAHRKGLTSDAFVGNAIVNFYGRCGAVEEAVNAFYCINHLDSVSCTVMLSAYIQQGKGKKALQLYSHMQREGVQVDAQMLTVALQACDYLIEEECNVHAKALACNFVQALHEDAERAGFTSDLFVATALVSIYSKCGALIEAEKVFNVSTHRDAIMWSTMLSAYIEHSQGEKALCLYRQMHHEDLKPNNISHAIALHACILLTGSVGVNCLEIGHGLHADARRLGFMWDIVICSILISLYGKFGSVVEAENVFFGMSQRDTLCWNAMLAVYASHGEGEKVLLMYRRMQNECAVLDDMTLFWVLQASTQLGSVELCKQLHFIAVCAGCNSSFLFGNSLVHAYGSLASMSDAHTLFKGLPQTDVASWNTFISGYTQQGDTVASAHIVEKMKLAGVVPDEVTFLLLLSSCCHTGLIDEGMEYFKSMNMDFHLQPEWKHYSVMVDLLGRVGDLEKVETFLYKMHMPVKPSSWLCLLSACRTHGNLQMGQMIFDHVVRLHPEEGAAYILMSNIYADAGLLMYVNKIESLRQNKLLR